MWTKQDTLTLQVASGSGYFVLDSDCKRLTRVFHSANLLTPRKLEAGGEQGNSKIQDNLPIVS